MVRRGENEEGNEDALSSAKKALRSIFCPFFDYSRSHPRIKRHRRGVSRRVEGREGRGGGSRQLQHGSGRGKDE
jgi:hypothetical protein